MGMQSIRPFVSCQIQLLVTHARFTMSQQCHVTTTTSECAAFSSLSRPVCPSTPRMHKSLKCCVWDRSHQAANCFPLSDFHARCPLVAIFCRPHPMFRNTNAPPRGATTMAPISPHILRFDQQSHSHFNVAIKRSACSRGLVVGLTNTSCCGVCGAQLPESAAKVPPKTGGCLGKYFLHLERVGERHFLEQKKIQVNSPSVRSSHVSVLIRALPK